MRPHLNCSPRELAWAWLAATALSGAPSTLYALFTGGDVGAALAFWPQMADHLMWGLCLGLTLQRDLSIP